MKKISTYILALAVALSLIGVNAHAQSKSFEGTMSWSMMMPQMGGDPIPMTMNFKNGKIEQEVDMGTQGKVKTFVVTENNTRKAYTVLEAMNAGYVMDLPSDSELSQTKSSASAAELTATGKKATIAGHAAEEYTISTKDGIDTLWGSSDFPKAMQESLAKAMGEQPRQSEATSGAFRAFAAKGLFPVRLVFTKDGETAMSMELVNFAEKSLPDALFVPPTDITYRPIPTGMGGGN